MARDGVPLVSQQPERGRSGGGMHNEKCGLFRFRLRDAKKVTRATQHRGSTSHRGTGASVEQGKRRLAVGPHTPSAPE
jgi:hypothetical protein